jgi:hypothetical protein
MMFFHSKRITEMYLLNEPIRAVFCDGNGRCRIDIIPAGAQVCLRGPSPFAGMVEVIWGRFYCNIFLTDLENRSVVLLSASA